MKINLKEDVERISAYVRQRIVDYSSKSDQGPGENEDPITQITLGYDVAELGWVAMVFDTRPNGPPDGEWQSYIVENWIGFPAWSEAFDALLDSGEAIELTLPTGRKKILIYLDDFVEHIGKMLKDILLDCRMQNCFDKLPIASKSCLSVEDDDGMYGWPEYEKRFKDGRIK